MGLELGLRGDGDGDGDGEGVGHGDRASIRDLVMGWKGWGGGIGPGPSPIWDCYTHLRGYCSHWRYLRTIQVVPPYPITQGALNHLCKLLIPGSTFRRFFAFFSATKSAMLSITENRWLCFQQFTFSNLV